MTLFDGNKAMMDRRPPIRIPVPFDVTSKEINEVTRAYIKLPERAFDDDDDSDDVSMSTTKLAHAARCPRSPKHGGIPL